MSLSSDNEDVMMPDVATMKRAKSMRSLAPDSDVVAFARASVELLVDYFKMVMASLLAVFVPQACPLLDPPTSPPICANAFGGVETTSDLWLTFNQSTHDCSMYEQFHYLTPYNQFVLGWNFITLGVMLFHYTLMWRREKFCTEKLKQSIVVSKINLKDVLPKYPRIRAGLHWYNKHVLLWSIIGAVVQLINFIVSAILVFNYYYEGYRTVTTFLTSTLLVATVCQRAGENCWIGLKHELAYSCVIYEPVSYNDIDDREVVLTHRDTVEAAEAQGSLQ